MMEARPSAPILRAFWYDASRYAVADTVWERLAAPPRVNLCLGGFGVEGKRSGVDLRIGLDLVSHL